MNRETVSGIMLTMLLVGILTLAFNIQPVRSETNTNDWSILHHDIFHTGCCKSKAELADIVKGVI